MRLTALVSAILLAAWPVGADSPAGPASLQDQFGRKSVVGIGSGRGFLLLISDRPDAAESVELWIRSLAPLPAGVDPWFVADLRALPFFIPHAAITGWLARRHPGNPVLIDWTGDFSRRFAPTPGDVTVLVFNAEGFLLGRASGLPTAEKLAELGRSLEKAGEKKASLP